MQKKEDPPIWLMFASQVYLDIIHILRKDISRGFVDLVLTTTHTITSIKGYFEFAINGNMYCAAWDTARNDVGFAHTMRMIEDWITVDRRGRRDCRIRKSRNGGKDGIESAPVQLLPTPPNLLRYYAVPHDLVMQDLGMKLADAWGSIMSVAHLYNATLNEGYTKAIWADMETIIQLHSESRMFVGSRPKQPKDYLRRFALVNGAGAQSYAANRRSSTRQDDFKAERRRGLERNSTLHGLLFPRYVPYLGDDPRLQLTLDNVESLLNSLVRHELTQAASSKSSPKKLHAKSSNLAGHFLKYHKLTSIELLDALRGTLESEHTSLNFNYLAMHERCMRLLRQVHTAVNSRFVRVFPTHSRDGKFLGGADDKLPSISGWIFMTANSLEMVKDNKQLTEQVQAARASGAGQPLVDAAVVLEPCIEKEGDAEISKIKKMKEVGLQITKPSYGGEIPRLITELKIFIGIDPALSHETLQEKHNVPSSKKAKEPAPAPVKKKRNGKKKNKNKPQSTPVVTQPKKANAAASTSASSLPGKRGIMAAYYERNSNNPYAPQILPLETASPKANKKATKTKRQDAAIAAALRDLDSSMDDDDDDDDEFGSELDDYEFVHESELTPMGKVYSDSIMKKMTSS